jgi:hypothetical protein
MNKPLPVLNISTKVKAFKSFDLKALKLAAPGIISSNQIMQAWADLACLDQNE